MPPKKVNKANQNTTDESESYYVSVRDLPFDILRQRATDKTISGPAERRAARRELLIKMGAKPPKGDAINYRVLMEAKKRERLTAISNYKNVSLHILCAFLVSCLGNSSS